MSDSVVSAAMEAAGRGSLNNSYFKAKLTTWFQCAGGLLLKRDSRVDQFPLISPFLRTVPSRLKGKQLEVESNLHNADAAFAPSANCVTSNIKTTWRVWTHLSGAADAKTRWMEVGIGSEEEPTTGTLVRLVLGSWNLLALRKSELSRWFSK